MGTINNGILGGVSGKVGGVVGANWKGIDTLRAYTVPANPNSSAQQTQRGLFGAIVAFSKLVLSTVIQAYWDPFSVKQSGFNSFMSANLNSWTSATDYDNAVMSEGSLESEDILDAILDGTNVVIEWTPSGLGNGLDTDIACGVVIDSANNIAFVKDVDARSDQAITIPVGSGRTVGDLKAYLFFHRGTGEALEVSNSDFRQVSI